ncbi:MAG: glycosyltransferase [Pseudomonadota bacterium]|nr:glycosyltransferase [Pseudomonadota bacterium]
MIQNEQIVQLSVIVPVGVRFENLTELYGEYKRGLEPTGARWEMVFVLDGPHPECERELKALCARGEPVVIISLTRRFGESTALMAGFDQATGEVVVTLPAYHQIEADDIRKLLNGLEGADICIGHRSPRKETMPSRIRRSAFHKLVSWVTAIPLRDLGCGARAMKRRVLEEISLYGDQHRFLAVLADRQGFRVREIDMRQSPKDDFKGMYRASEYTHRILDIFTVFFLVRFTKKPLRFFGMVGVTTFGIGLLLVLVLVAQRLAFHQALADRPALLLSSLLVVLGFQLFALGLLGELIIFTHAKNIKDYQVDRVIEFTGSGTEISYDAPQQKTGSG